MSERENGSPHVVVFPKNTKKGFVVRIVFRRADFLSCRYEYDTSTTRVRKNHEYRQLCLAQHLSSNFAHISFLTRKLVVFHVGFVSEESVVAECYVVRTFFKTEMRGNGMNE